MANVLPFDRQVEVIAALTEGVSIRATERLTGIHRDTIMRLGVRVGRGCDVLHHKLMRGLRVSRLELDEAWSYVGKKQKCVGESSLAARHAARRIAHPWGHRRDRPELQKTRIRSSPTRRRNSGRRR